MTAQCQLQPQPDLFDPLVTLEDHLKSEGVSPRLFEGATDLSDQRARARIAIVMGKLGAKTTRTGKTYAELFAQTYGEPLVRETL